MVRRLAVASLSARMLVEAARAGGYRPIALDLFGDADTRQAAEEWLPIGDGGRLAIDGRALLAALHKVQSRGEAVGWIAGSGFEGQPELLAQGDRILPLLGNGPEAVARVRSPSDFFGRLAALGIPHPETSMVLPRFPSGWLRKDAGSCGGWEVRPASPAAAEEAAGVYYQRISPGLPMSALFLADGRRGHLLGVNVQIAGPLGSRPYVFRGCAGPLDPSAGLRRQLAEILDALVGDFGLKGLNGLDFLLDGDRLAVLEVNPRPPASLDLYRGILPGGLIGAHLEASLDRRLPQGMPARRTGPVRGFEVLFSRRPCRLSPQALAALERLSWCHDRPAAPQDMARGEPVCTVSAEAGSIPAVQVLLRQRRQQISSLLEISNEACSRGSDSDHVSREGELECQ